MRQVPISVIPAKAGIHLFLFRDSCPVSSMGQAMRRSDERGANLWYARGKQRHGSREHGQNRRGGNRLECSVD